MRSQLTSLERNYDRLTAKERAILSLKGWKNDEEPDEALKRSTPAHDVRMVRRYLDALKDTQSLVGGLAGALEAKLESIQARLGLVYALRFWEGDADWLRVTVQFDLPEILTASEAEAAIRRTREQRWSIADCGRHLVDIDIEEDDEIAAECRVQEKRLRAAIKTGELKAVRGRVAYGDLVDWTGVEVRLLPNTGLHVAVLPDSCREYVAQANATRETLLKHFQEVPGQRDGRVAALSENILSVAAHSLGEAEVMRLSLEELVAWTSDDFDGEEAIHPDLRDQLDGVASTVTALVEEMGTMGCELDLPVTGDEDFVESLKRVIAAGH